VIAAGEDGYELIRSIDLGADEALFDHVFVKKHSQLDAERFSVTMEPTSDVRMLESVGKHTTNFWSEQRIGTSFFGRSVERELCKVDRNQMLVLERRRVFDLANDVPVREALSGTVISTDQAPSARQEVASARYLAAQFYSSRGGVLTEIKRAPPLHVPSSVGSEFSQSA
jgi:hypothetical protein